MTKYDLDSLLKRATSELNGVHETVKEKAFKLVTSAYDKGYKVLITQGLRTIAQQNALYAQGRTKPGKVVTKARGGYSYHNFGLAFDIAYVGKDNEIDWNNVAAYRAIARIGQDMGLTWGGDWDGDGRSDDETFLDYPHFQFTFGLTLSQLRAGKKPPSSVNVVDSSPNKPAVTKPVTYSPIVPYPGLLKLGSKGINVKRVQRAAGMPESLVDGVYGQRTKSYVEAYQTKKKLTVDGLVGKKTWNMMF